MPLGGRPRRPPSDRAAFVAAPASPYGRAHPVTGAAELRPAAGALAACPWLCLRRQWRFCAAKGPTRKYIPAVILRTGAPRTLRAAQRRRPTYFRQWFAGRLRELRAVRGWTQQQLAGAAGVTAAAVKSLERGRNSPTWETVVALCRALDVTPDTFAQAPGVPAAAAGPPPQSSADPEPPGGKPKRRDRGA